MNNKLLYGLILVAIILTVVGCGSSDAPSQTDDTTTDTTTSTGTTTVTVDNTLSTVDDELVGASDDVDVGEMY